MSATPLSVIAVGRTVWKHVRFWIFEMLTFKIGPGHYMQYGMFNPTGYVVWYILSFTTYNGNDLKYRNAFWVQVGTKRIGYMGHSRYNDGSPSARRHFIGRAPYHQSAQTDKYLVILGGEGCMRIHVPLVISIRLEICWVRFHQTCGTLYFELWNVDPFTISFYFNTWFTAGGYDQCKNIWKMRSMYGEQCEM